MKPSKIKILKAKKTWFLRSNFKGITWMGVVYCRNDAYINEINNADGINSNFESHEMIHVRQAQAMNDSWFRFYFDYVISYLKNISLITINIQAPYKLIPTEIEAYLNQDNWNYASEAKGVYGWKEFKKLTLGEKREIATKYYKSNEKKSFTAVLHEFLENKGKKRG